MKREILKIDEDLCNGCGQCVPNCHEGALKVIDGKVRLVSELMCDGLGACIGHCPKGAITVETREAEPYDEKMVMREMVRKGRNTILAHLMHLKDHGETVFLKEGVTELLSLKDSLSFDPEEIIREVHDSGIKVNLRNTQDMKLQDINNIEGGCPGSKAMVIEKNMPVATATISGDTPSELRQWPVQMHLINPSASYFAGADLLLAADCVAFSSGSFHSKYLKGKSLAIACPKLDHGMESYVQKLTALIENAKVNTINVMMMEVPCCSGLLRLVKAAQANSSRKVPVKRTIISIAGEVLDEEWI